MVTYYHGIKFVPWNAWWICLHSIWNPVESMWNWSFHPHSTWNPWCPWNKKLAGVSGNIHSMDSIWNNPGKVKTSSVQFSSVQLSGTQRWAMLSRAIAELISSQNGWGRRNSDSDQNWSEKSSCQSAPIRTCQGETRPHSRQEWNP